MKKILIAYGALVIVVIILAFAKFNDFNFIKKPTAEINKQKFDLMIAKDDKSRQIGLSKRKSLKETEGMLFIFDKKGKYSFWMKDTMIPLDIIYIEENKIVYIQKNAVPQYGKTGNLPIYTPTSEAKYVLEINGGLSDKYDIKVGDNVIFNGVK